MKRYTRSGVLLVVAIAGTGLQVSELLTRCGLVYNVLVLTLMAGLSGVTLADYLYHRALTRHMNRISLKAAARRGVPSGGKQPVTEASQHVG